MQAEEQAFSMSSMVGCSAMVDPQKCLHYSAHILSVSGPLIFSHEVMRFVKKTVLGALARFGCF
jgi:hypothetical protein